MNKAVKKPLHSAFLRKCWQLLIMVLAFTSVNGQADAGRYTPISSYGVKYKRFATDSVQLLPLYASPHIPYRAGAIKYRESDSSFYKWTGTQWLKVQEGSSTATNGIDTVYTQDDTIQVIVTPGETYYTIINSPYTEVINDSTIVIGGDTLVINGKGPSLVGITELAGDGTAGPGSGLVSFTLANTGVTPGSYINPNITVDSKGRVTGISSGGVLGNNANIGAFFRWLLPGTQEIKTVASSNTINWDSTSSTNALTAKVDTSVIATQYDLAQAQGTLNSNAGSGFRILKPGSQEIKTLFNSSTIEWDSVSNVDGLTPKVVDASIGATQLTNNGVTYAKIQQVSANRLLGNPTGSAANVNEIPLGFGLEFNSNALRVNTSEISTVQRLIDSAAEIRADFPAGGTNLTAGMNATKFTNNQTGLPYINAGSPINSSDTFYILASGQSNAGFSSTGTSNVYDTLLNHRVEIWDWISNSWALAVVGKQPFTSNGNVVSGNAIWYFAKKVQEQTGKHVRIVLHYKNSTAISGWFTTTKQAQLDSLLDKATASGIPRADAFVWIQGENDFATNHLTYIERFEGIKAILRAQSYFPLTTPILVVGMPKQSAGASATFAEADKPLGYTNFNTDLWDAYANTDSALVQADATHYNNFGLKKIGAEKIYAAYNSLPQRTHTYIYPQYIDITHRDENAVTARQESMRIKNTSQRGVAGINITDSVGTGRLRFLHLPSTATFSPYTAGSNIISSDGTFSLRIYHNFIERVTINASNFDVSGVIPRINNTTANFFNYIDYNNTTNNGDWRVGATDNTYTAAPINSFVWYNLGANAFGMNLRKEGALTIGGNANFHTNRTLYVGGSIGADKDSIAFILSPSTHDIIVQDTSGAIPVRGQFRRLRTSFFASQSALNDSAAAIRAAVGGSATTLYNGDGALSGNRTVTMSGNTVNFTGGDFGIGISPTQRLHVSGNGLFTGSVTVADAAYDATTWNGSAEVPTKNAVRDKIESIVASYEMPFSDITTTTIANTTTETTLYGTGVGTAAYSNITAGSSLVLQGYGRLSSGGSPTAPTLECTIGTLTIGIVLSSFDATLTNAAYRYKFEIIPKATGTSQDVFYNITFEVMNLAGTGWRVFSSSSEQAGGFTTTGSPAADVTWTWGNADASNSITAYKNTVEIFRK